MSDKTTNFGPDGRVVSIAASSIVVLLAIASWWQTHIVGDADEMILAPLAILQFAGLAVILIVTFMRMPKTDGLTQSKCLAVAVGLIFSVLLLDRLFLAHDAFETFETVADIGLLALWLAGGLLVVGLVMERSSYWPAVAAVTAGLVVQICLSLLEVGEMRIETFAELEVPGLDLVEEIAVVGIVMLYGFALVTDTLWRRAMTGGRKFSLNETMVNLESRPIAGQLSIAGNDMAYWLWKRSHPGQKFADFYAWQITRMLDRGRAHRTLGKRRFLDDTIVTAAPGHDAVSFASRRSSIVDLVFEMGLEASHTLVDYGCGSLRNGQHFIRYLDAGNYWGLDVTDRFYRDGLAMLPPELVVQKNPNLRVVDAQSLSEVAALNVEFIVSIAVLKHVPPGELDGFIKNLAKMLGSHSRLFLNFSHADTESRIKGKSWAYPAAHIAKLIEENCPAHRTRLVRIDDAQMGAGVEYRTCTMLVEPFV